MRSALVLAFLLAASTAFGQDPSNLTAGDQVLSTSPCRRGFTALSSTMSPGVLAPSVRESSGGTLSTGPEVQVPIAVSGSAWCRVNEPTNLLAGDWVISSPSCRPGFVSGGQPVINTRRTAGPPLADGGASTINVFAAPGTSWCRATEPSNLLEGDLLARAACTGGWRPAPASMVPFVLTERMGWRNRDGYSFSNGSNRTTRVVGGLWCVL